MGLRTASRTNVCTGLTVERIGVDCISAGNGLSAIPAHYGVGTIVTFDFAGVRKVFPTTDTARLRADCHENIIRRISENREISVIIVIFKFSDIVRRVIYTTNAIESLNSGFRRLNRSRNVFPDSKALLKALYLAADNITKKWTNTLRDWGQVYAELSVMYGERLS